VGAGGLGHGRFRIQTMVTAADRRTGT
jgi:hypothetical protein